MTIARYAITFGLRGCSPVRLGQRIPLEPQESHMRKSDLAMRRLAETDAGYHAEMTAARAMLAALKDIVRRDNNGESTSSGDWIEIYNAIAAAEAAGIE